LTAKYDTSNMAVSQKSKFFTTKGAKDFHKEHKALLNNIYICVLCVDFVFFVVKKAYETASFPVVLTFDEKEWSDYIYNDGI